MELAQIVEGKTYQYFPATRGDSDNEHYPATVLEIRKRVKVKLVSIEYPDGVESGSARAGCLTSSTC